MLCDFLSPNLFAKNTQTNLWRKSEVYYDWMKVFLVTGVNLLKVKWPRNFDHLNAWYTAEEDA